MWSRVVQDRTIRARGRLSNRIIWARGRLVGVGCSDTLELILKIVDNVLMFEIESKGSLVSLFEGAVLRRL